MITVQTLAEMKMGLSINGDDNRSWVSGGDFCATHPTSRVILTRVERELETV